MLMHAVGVMISFVKITAQNRHLMLWFLPPELSCSRSLEDPNLAIKADPAYMKTRSTDSYMAGASPHLQLLMIVVKVKGRLT